MPPRMKSLPTVAARTADAEHGQGFTRDRTGGREAKRNPGKTPFCSSKLPALGLPDLTAGWFESARLISRKSGVLLRVTSHERARSDAGLPVSRTGFRRGRFRRLLLAQPGRGVRRERACESQWRRGSRFGTPRRAWARPNRRDGQPVRRGEGVSDALNKPRGLVTTAADEQGRATVFECLSQSDASEVPSAGSLPRCSLSVGSTRRAKGCCCSPTTRLGCTHHRSQSRSTRRITCKGLPGRRRARAAIIARHQSGRGFPGRRCACACCATARKQLAWDRARRRQELSHLAASAFSARRGSVFGLVRVGDWAVAARRAGQREVAVFRREQRSWRSCRPRKHEGERQSLVDLKQPLAVLTGCATPCHTVAMKTAERRNGPLHCRRPENPPGQTDFQGHARYRCRCVGGRWARPVRTSFVTAGATARSPWRVAEAVQLCPARAAGCRRPACSR